MEVFIHHIYEYQKGIRNLILHTTEKNNIEIIKEKLSAENIDYIIYPFRKAKNKCILWSKGMCRGNKKYK